MPGKVCKKGRKHTKVELAYMAGFIDADGFISINKYCPRKNKSAGKYDYNLRIGSVNTCRELLEWIQSQFGGAIYKRKPVNPEKHKVAYAWQIDSKKAEMVIKQILPYLKRKRLQAETVLEFRKTYASNNYIHYENGKQIGTKIKDNVVDLREHYRQKVKTLNRRGPRDDKIVSKA